MKSSGDLPNGCGGALVIVGPQFALVLEELLVDVLHVGRTAALCRQELMPDFLSNIDGSC